MEQSYIAYGGDDISVLLGSSFYKDMKEPGTIVINGAEKVLLHPRLSGSKPRVFNLALIVFKAPVQFSNYISPVCLRHSEDKMIGQTMFAAGFGVDMHGNLAGFKKQMPMTVLDTQTCQKFFLATLQKGKASKFFCARGNGQETPCRYDKPLYVKQDDRWYLRAMSSSFKVFKNKLCRPRAPVLYEDIGFMLDWIESEISNNKIDD